MGFFVVSDRPPISFLSRQLLHRLLLLGSNDSVQFFACMYVLVCVAGSSNQNRYSAALEVGHIMDSLIKNFCMGVGQRRF